MSTVRNRSRSDTATAVGSRPPESGSSRITIKLPSPAKRKRQRGSSPTGLAGLESDFFDQIPDYPSETGPSRQTKRRKVEVESTSPKRTPQKTHAAIQQHRKSKKKKEDEPEEEEVLTAAVIIPLKSKHKTKGKQSAEVIDDDSQIPITKMGPPRGAKKRSSRSKSYSNSISQTGSKANDDYPRNAKSEVQKPVSTHTPSPLPQTPPKITKESTSSIDDDERMGLAYPDSTELQLLQFPEDSLFTPGPDDGYDENEEPGAASPIIPRPSSQSGDEDLEDNYRGQMKLGSPEVPETQSQESGNDVAGGSPPSIPTPVALARPSTPIHPSWPKSNVNGSPASASAPSSPAVSFLKTPPRRTGVPRELRRVPYVSPSAFHPHLPSSSVHDRSPSVEVDEADVEADAPLSSIEDFSPEKSIDHGKPVDSIKNWGDHTQSQLDTIMVSDDDLRARGQELVDNEYKKKEREGKKKEKGKIRRSLSEVLKAVSREPESQPDPILTLGSMDESAVQDMEDLYVDLNGGGGEGLDTSLEYLPMAQEEEESTQDLLMEREELARQLAAVNDGESNDDGFDQDSHEDVCFPMLGHRFLD